MWKEPPINLSQLPREPGVYRMLDSKRQVLYVGKARNLRKRVSSYFQRQPESPRTQAMVSQICDIEFTITTSESMALIQEHNLIKQLKPRYNVLLKDSKSYPYILLTDEAYPRLQMYRGKRDVPGEYYGPFANAHAVHQTLHLMQSAFHIRDCDNAEFNHRSRPCMQHQIGRCSAPCCDIVSQQTYAEQVSEARALLLGKDQELLRQWEGEMMQAAERLAYERARLFRDQIRALRTILADAEQSELPANADAIVWFPASQHIAIGVRRNARDLGVQTIRIKQAIDADDTEVLQALVLERYREEMPPAEILLWRDDGLCQHITSLLRLLHASARFEVRHPQRGPRAQWLETAQKSSEQVQASKQQQQQAAFEAVATLLDLPATPRLIAAVDNAHLGGQQTVAAMVYGGWQGPEKNLYRRYKLDDTESEHRPISDGDDYAAMEQVLSRFFKAINSDDIPAPDLLLIDGGKGQLKVAMEEAAKASLADLKIVAIAKGAGRKVGNETLFPAWDLAPMQPGRDSAALMLMARIRDEAHRFAGEYMRNRKKKAMFTSRLDGIDGVGTQKRAALLRHFGGIEGVKKASREDLAKVPGFSSVLAERIFQALHQ
ncbi:MAG: excinuclease ABC subunit UvrC [Zetaproteobacteria bacterium CG_4_9_14_3_um_filter_49_83]|nr:MAG: excinuclease ABC subunit C [Zetaproteobacteria bacterium CG1_02_49_23]PIQ32794.1 MAG: excinuclease ABC subunit C [Zetaproteobacteria bacterium CG17_big_fil_post_rev_8_21_14_2_50_50_13]PIV29862.1 MAG: excinuclease ABC subunit UvrC [Zetaproteobacteria bacterium CG02_land_8_20_14_3_00_50_9]PIY56671.1 MAG: excinuclease ABC subunit UvrC [Zetaproteobacteria bacterium CG_4_10_14_0_8_um_filter_49_80]PJA33760.1 MAG: excinuclease ABC subunit UvrC [Zetaproteobacteria bacterium CG_4_9_14_3_um_filte